MLSINRKTETDFQQLADFAPVMIWRSDKTKAYSYFNRPWLKFTGRTMGQELGYGWTEGIHPDDYCGYLRTYTEAFEARREFRMDYRLHRHDGVYRWVLDTGKPCFHADGSFTGYFGSCVDITDVKEMEERLTRALDEKERLVTQQEHLLREKELLLQEVHHRTRNSLQLAISLLCLQAAELPDGILQEPFEQAVLRVKAVATAQDNSHRTHDFLRIRLRPFVETLLAPLIAQASPQPIRFQVWVAQIDIPFELGVPIALIVSELAGNALRHAFPDGRPGTVSVTGDMSAAGVLSLTVADDGIGLPAGIDEHEGGGLGMILTRRLAKQARAHLKILPGRGTLISVSMPIAFLNGSEACRAEVGNRYNQCRG